MAGRINITYLGVHAGNDTSKVIYDALKNEGFEPKKFQSMQYSPAKKGTLINFDDCKKMPTDSEFKKIFPNNKFLEVLITKQQNDI